jgi:hypothetical protein
MGLIQCAMPTVLVMYSGQPLLTSLTRREQKQFSASLTISPTGFSHTFRYSMGLAQDQRAQAPLVEKLKLDNWGFSPYASQPSKNGLFGTTEKLKARRSPRQWWCSCYGSSDLHVVVSIKHFLQHTVINMYRDTLVQENFIWDDFERNNANLPILPIL